MHGNEINPHIVLPDHLRKLSGKRSPAAIRRWARAQNIRVKEGVDGPWTTVDAINEALGLRRRSKNDITYRPDEVI